MHVSQLTHPALGMTSNSTSYSLSQVAIISARAWANDPGAMTLIGSQPHFLPCLWPSCTAGRKGVLHHEAFSQAQSQLNTLVSDWIAAIPSHTAGENCSEHTFTLQLKTNKHSQSDCSQGLQPYSGDRLDIVALKELLYQRSNGHKCRLSVT